MKLVLLEPTKKAKRDKCKNEKASRNILTVPDAGIKKKLVQFIFQEVKFKDFLVEK